MRRRLYVLVEPPASPPLSSSDRSLRDFCAVDDFAAAMGAAAGAPIPVIEVPLVEAPRDALIVGFFGDDPGWSLGSLPPEAQSEVCRKLVMLNGGRGNVLQMLEQWELAAAVDAYSYSIWQRERPRDGGGGLIGRIDVAASIGITALTQSLYASTRYAMLKSEGCPDMPSLVWAYLEGYEKLVLG